MSYSNKASSGQKSERVNEDIHMPKIRLIDSNGAQVGIVPTDQALQMAYNQGLDLVEVQPNTRPPVCRIMDYGKFKYEKTKKNKAARKKQQSGVVKEMRFSAKISAHDYSYKMQHIRDFLLNHDKVKVSVRFRGREITRLELGEALIDKLKKDVGDIASVEQESKMEGRSMIMMLAPDSKKISAYKSQKKKDKDKEED